MVLQKKSSILSKPVTQCVDYIYSNIKERITIADLAAYTGLSESYLSRVFKQNLGVSISDYIREKKIEKAEKRRQIEEQKRLERQHARELQAKLQKEIWQKNLKTATEKYQ